MINLSNTNASDPRTLVRRRRGLFLAEGVALVLLGCAAVVLPTVATLALEFCIGWILLISGIIGAGTTLLLRRSAGFGWSLVSAIVAIAAGAALLRWPLSGTVSLTLILILFFILEGLASIMFASAHRADHPGRWGWMSFSGALDLGLAVLILAGLPSTSRWAIGLLVGINMIFGGSALLAMVIRRSGIDAQPGTPEAIGGAAHPDG